MVLLISLNILIPLSLVAIIIIFLLWLLYNKNKYLTEKLISEKTRFNRYKQGIMSLKNNPTLPEKDFESLSKYVRAFFKEYLDLDYSLTYLELEAEFKKQKKPEYANFSKLMSDISYKGERKNREEIKQLIEMFWKILESY